MDLPREVDRLRLDLLAVHISRELCHAGVPHALLKGPSTANWLYDPPRGYNDVDVLVPLSAVNAAVQALQGAGIARPGAGRLGEEAEHSLLMLSAAGYEVDVHISLPTLPPAGDLVWDVLESHVMPLDLGVGTVPALDEPARCLVVALHALNCAGPSRGVEDLRRARAAANDKTWRAARELATRLEAADLFDAALTMVEPGEGNRPMSPRARLHATGAPSAAIGLQKLSDARRRDLPSLLWREFLPTRGFMERANVGLTDSWLGLARAYVRRWLSLARQMPAALNAWRAARR